MCEDVTRLDDLQAKSTDIIKQAEELRGKMMDFKEKLKENVSSVIERTPLLISHSQRVPTNLDSEDVESYQLPPPIIPQVCTRKLRFLSPDRTSQDVCYLKNVRQIYPHANGESSNNNGIMTDLSSDLMRTSLVEDSVTPSPTFDFPSFIGDDSLEVSRGEDETSLISLDTQSDLAPGEIPLFKKHTTDSLMDECLTPETSLPPALKPINCEDYHGFTIQGSNIPTIPCNTGDSSKASTDLDSNNYSNYFQNM